MAKTATRSIVKVPASSTVKLSLPRMSGIAPKRKGRRGRRRSGASRGRVSSGGMSRVMDWGWALLALDFAMGAVGDKLPLIVDDAGKEGSLAVLAYFMDADKYVKGVEDVAIILAIRKYLENTMTKKLTAPGEGGAAKGGFGL